MQLTKLYHNSNRDDAREQLEVAIKLDNPRTVTFEIVVATTISWITLQGQLKLDAYKIHALNRILFAIHFF